MSLNTSKNLGQISSVFFGTTAPSNVNLIWMDTNSTPYIKMVWNGIGWVPLATGGFGITKLRIIVGSGGYTLGGGGTTLTGAFFSNAISEIVTDRQNYQFGVDFSQLGTTITGIDGVTFYTGQIMIAKV